MKRKTDSYLNATQILKVAGFDKPQRTRILEKEIQTGHHEKVQGGYGKYQGTWVPFERGIALAEQYKVDILLRPLFDFIQGEVSPPLAPRQFNNASSKIKKFKTTESKKRKVNDLKLDLEEQIDEISLTDLETKNRPRKRKRPFLFELGEEQQLLLGNEYPTYAQQLLQYFISDELAIPVILLKPPADLDINVIIDDEGHTSLHWAAAMGRLKLVNILIDLGADIYRVNYKGQTALMRRQNNFSELMSILNVQDIYGDTALNIAARIGNRKLVRLLIEAGASLEIANEEGMSAQDYLAEAERNNQNGNKSLLEPHRTESNQREVLRQKVEGLFKTIIVNEKPPIISHMFNGFTSNYERDLMQKDNLIKEKKNELVLIKKRLAGTQHTLEQIQFDPTKMQQVEAESAILSKLLLKQTQILQKMTLQQLVRKQDIQKEKKEEIVLDDLLNQVKKLQEVRKKRAQELIQLKLQTPSKKHQKYKRLISMCCSVSYENVDLMLLPLLSSFDELLSSQQKSVN
ncbi:hypothetical protein G6F46_001884 [Rhizopus delemar]|nr:hypothetical protein G6F55_000520 [Rhizopus delemar]KAG1551337.1 hypothetical protein G6F51_001905 [Rhizopus arrhizus]KAG1504022.1 hypothetical protein G6F54_001284 [Rhizopus delemar]KAG1517342.1 hypothetical protein G6F53_001443 [Rhizopus delemar]KAG1528769.1 hypothetical protein G6F52_000358 [Rhizopus delemar]